MHSYSNKYLLQYKLSLSLQFLLGSILQVSITTIDVRKFLRFLYEYKFIEIFHIFLYSISTF